MRTILLGALVTLGVAARRPGVYHAHNIEGRGLVGDGLQIRDYASPESEEELTDDGKGGRAAPDDRWNAGPSAQPYGYPASKSAGTATTQPSASGYSPSASAPTVVSPSPSGTNSTGSCGYWYESIPKLGIAPLADPGYAVYRNVRDFGAVGDGVSDDTAAINTAISSGNRCAPGVCGSTTRTPAVVYFPPGTYLISAPIIDYYYTQIIGNPNCLPVIKAATTFQGDYILDGDPYINGQLGYGATNIFWRQVRNLVLDTRAVAPETNIRAVHWPTGQATSLQNIVFKLSDAPGSRHEGLFIEQGSGGLVTDLVFEGGLNGLNLGNQQFTMRNLTFTNVQTAIFQQWDWGWTYTGLAIKNCSVGLNMSSANPAGALTVSSVILIDSTIVDTPIAILTGRTPNANPPEANSLIVENLTLRDVATAVQGPNGTVLLAGPGSGTSITPAWAHGTQYDASGQRTELADPIAPFPRPTSLIDASGRFYARSKPQYERYPAGAFLSARAAGAAGDGVADDTEALNGVIWAAVAKGKVLFLEAGTYRVTKTIYIPAGARIVGEAYPVILSSGDFFADVNNPQPVVQVGKAGDVGQVEWSDTIVSTQGAQAGAILIQWKLQAPSTAPSGLWDVHTRIGGFAGSQLQVAECPKTPNVTVGEDVPPQCIAAFMGMHIAPSASGVYLENVWNWVADHDVEDASLTQITVYSGRGLLVESERGGIWFVGTSVEHHVLYQYQLRSTRDLFLGQIQTETAYYQPNPPAEIPFAPVAELGDPVFSGNASGWGLRVVDSSSIGIYGAGLYSFFTNYDVHCSDQGNGRTRCQDRILSVEKSSIVLYNLNTVGVTNMITADGVDVTTFLDNPNGFVSTVARFSS